MRSPDLYCEQLRPTILIATLLQHLTPFRKGPPPDFEGGS